MRVRRMILVVVVIAGAVVAVATLSGAGAATRPRSHCPPAGWIALNQVELPQSCQ